MEWDSVRWPNFSVAEMKCSHTGECHMDPEFMDMLQALRDECGRLDVSSGYRHPTHPLEAHKEKPGEHTLGKAADVVCWSDEAFVIAKAAMLLGFTRIGVSQNPRGARFIHLGTATPEEGFPPALYSY